MKIKKHIKRDILTESQVEFIIGQLEGRLDMQAFVILLYWTGARVNEALALKPPDIYNESGSLYINLPTLKRDRGKDVLIFRRNQELPWDRLPFRWRFVEYFNINKDNEDQLLFTFSERWIQIKLKKIGNKYPHQCGGEVWPHLFRHTRLQMLADTEIPIYALKAFSGHKSVKSLDFYIQRSRKQLRMARDYI